MGGSYAELQRPDQRRFLHREAALRRCQWLLNTETLPAQGRVVAARPSPTLTRNDDADGDGEPVGRGNHYGGSGGTVPAPTA